MASLLAAVHMFTCTLQCTRSCDWRREMRNLFLCSGSTDRGPTCVRIKGQREGNGTLKRTEKTKDSCSLSERTTHLASPRCTFYMCVLHTVGASVQKVCDLRREMGNLLLHNGPCFRKSKKAGDGLWGDGEHEGSLSE